MKKILFSLLAATVALVSCQKPSQVVSLPNAGSQREISAMLTSAGNTKGYITGTSFYDTAKDKLHDGTIADTDPANARVMYMSAFLVPQNGTPGTYFKNYTYKKGTRTNDVWHNFVGTVETPIYWPMGGTLSFLAVSAKTDLSSLLEWDKQNVASAVKLPVDRSFTQDDIVFSSEGNHAVSDGANVEMEFKHAQAWIEFQLTATEAGIITIKDIVIEDAYEKGELSILANNSNAVASWSFREEKRKDVLVDDTYSVYDSPLKVKVTDDATSIGFLDMLIPEQPKTSFLITYTLKGQDNVLTYRYELPHENFLMGKKYIYAFNFGINEITVDPSVVAFEEGTVTVDPLQ